MVIAPVGPGGRRRDDGVVVACPDGSSGRITLPGACTGHSESPGRPAGGLAGNHQPAPQGLAAVYPRQPSVAQVRAHTESRLH
jgi:hypothetical protein